MKQSGWAKAGQQKEPRVVGIEVVIVSAPSETMDIRNCESAAMIFYVLSLKPYLVLY